MDRKNELVTMYCLMGEAMFMLQLLEDCLSHSITLKNDIKNLRLVPKEKADEILKEYRRLPLGIAIKVEREGEIYSESLQKELQDFLSERNWLVHKCVPENLDDMDRIINASSLFNKIKTIGQKAQKIQRDIERDLADFSSSQGIDMSKVYAVLEMSR